MIPGAFKQNVMDALGLVRRTGFGGIYGTGKAWKGLGQMYMSPRLTMANRFSSAGQFAKGFFTASDFRGQGLGRGLIAGARAAPAIGLFSLFD
jgi:hypothetical protein